MIDFEMIGKRIREQRKYLHHISQEKMALDLGMYQADISNLEKAKSGSGIGDLYKLDLIADYFKISPETLIFGLGEDKMVRYYGKSQIKAVKNYRFSDALKEELERLSGFKNITEATRVYQWGPYTLYAYIEYQQKIAEQELFFCWPSIVPQAEFVLQKLHVYVKAGEEMLAAMIAALTPLGMYTEDTALAYLQKMITPDLYEVTDILRVLNPYWALCSYGSEEEMQTYEPLRQERNRALDAVKESGVAILESVYVRVDARRHGLLRLLVDLISVIFGSRCMLWLNLEPTSGEALRAEAGYHPAYLASEAGEININAAIAEKLGFTVDSKIVPRQVEDEDEDGNKTVRPVNFRKSAYLLPKCLRKLVQDDGDFAARGLALEQLQTHSGDGGWETVSFRDGHEGDYKILACQKKGYGTEEGRELWFYAAMTQDRESSRFGVTPFNPMEQGLDHPGQLFRCEFLDEAEDTDYYDELEMLLGALSAGMLGKTEDKVYKRYHL